MDTRLPNTEANRLASSLRARYSLSLLLCLLLGAGTVVAADFSNDQLEFFERKIRPLLTERCYECHSVGAKKLKGGLFLDSRDSALKGGDTRAAVVPGDPEKSLFIESITYKNQDLQMPPKTRLTDAQIADLTNWVKQGAPWPAESAPKKSVANAFDLAKRKAEHWSWELPKEKPLPVVKDAAWGESRIDRHVLAKLEEHKLHPAAPADKRTLIRRVSFDITGLPPSPSEVESFLNDNSTTALQKVVDRLLATEAFGERWARHWLDLVRYAETRGHEFEPIIPNAYQYRDYVIRALNQDVRYNDFVTEHIAGDLIPRPRMNAKTGANESILGTGFWFLGEEVHSPVDIRQDEADRMDNRLDVMSKTFLGLTVACARCHDHKFDAISQRDYYALTGFLISSTYRQARFETIEAHRQIAAQLDQLRTTGRPKLLQALAKAHLPGIRHTAERLLAAIDKPDASPPWTEELKLAAKSPEHPLHAFAALLRQKQAATAAEFAARLSPIVAALQKARTETLSPIKSEDIVVDYAKPGPHDWVQDGFSFGSRPAKIGDPVFGTGTGLPVAGFVSAASALRDPAWSKLAVKQSERDGGKIGSWERGEQTLRTPDVALRGSSLWYLARGSFHAYANVDSHLIIQGPLHGALLKDCKDDKDQWRWVQHPLASYAADRTHRVHAEFSPMDDRPFQIAMVVQSNTQPPMPDMSNELLIEALSRPGVTSMQSLAEALQDLFVRVAERIATDNLTADGSAALADWLVRHNDLFCPPGSRDAANLAADLKLFLSTQSELIARIQPGSQTAPAMLDGSGIDDFLLIRGQSKNPGERTPRRFLEAIAGTQSSKYAGSGRLELAHALTAPSNPFTSRVMVNRVWYHLFGRGIVPTVDNFGVLGQAPSHRELLDYLAVHFSRDLGWSVKSLIREIVLSKSYQMSSAVTDEVAERADPENILLHRMNVKRLEGEAIRDAVLAASGRLKPTTSGPSVMVYLTPFMDGRGKPGNSGPLDGDGRRSIYISVRRNFLQPMFLAFDAPIPFTSMGRRNVSNVPAQALIMMNDPFIIDQMHVWAKRLASISAPEERVRQMYLTAYSRPPTNPELQDALTFVREQAPSYGATPDDERVWADLCHVLVNGKEFIYLN